MCLALSKKMGKEKIITVPNPDMKGSSGFRKWRLFVINAYVVTRFDGGAPTGLSGVPWAAAWFWRSPLMATARPPPDHRSRSKCRTNFFSFCSRIALVPFELLVAAEVGPTGL